MSTSRTIRTILLLAAALATARPVAAAESAPSTAIDAEILRLRETAWRAWFDGDESTLRSILPPEFIGINMGDAPFSDLEKTLAESRSFKAGGGRLVKLEFPETRAQRSGDTVVLYGRFSVVLEEGGKQQTLAGRLTEVFVRRNGKWWHPGWHLDLASTPKGPAAPSSPEKSE